jgi:hypothetical protein
MNEHAARLLTDIRAGKLDPRNAAEALGLPFDQDIITGILADAASAHPSQSAIAEAERALEPFAAQADVWHESEPGGALLTENDDDNGNKSDIRLRHCRAAASALTALRAIPAMTGAADPRNREEASAPSQPNGWRESEG